VDALGLERFDLLGHSMGGINAIVYAARFPARVSRLLVEDAGPGAFEASPGAIRIRRELATTPSHFATWDDARDFMRALRPSVTEEAREQRLKSMLRPTSGGGFTWQYDHMGIAATRLNPDPARVVDLRPPVAELACETLVVRGGNSDYLQPEMVEDMQRLNPRIRSAVVLDAGHYIHDDQPALFHRLARDFLVPTH
jgi:esterase